MWKPHELDRVLNPALQLGLASATNTQAEGHVLKHRQVGKQGIALKNEPNVAAIGRTLVDPLSIKIDPSFTRGLETGNAAQRRCLAAPARTE